MKLTPLPCPQRLKKKEKKEVRESCAKWDTWILIFQILTVLTVTSSCLTLIALEAIPDLSACLSVHDTGRKFHTITRTCYYIPALAAPDGGRRGVDLHR